MPLNVAAILLFVLGVIPLAVIAVQNNGGLASPSLLYRQALGASVAAVHQPAAISDLRLNIQEILQDIAAKKPNVTGLCVNEITLIVESTINLQPWAFEYFDTEPLKPPGVLTGNLKWYGDFDECLGIGPRVVNKTVTITPKYCRIDIGDPNIPSLGPTLFDPTTVAMLMVGICVPSSCQVEILEQLINPYLGNYTGNNLQVLPGTSYCFREELPYTTEFYITVAIFSVVAALLLGTFSIELVIKLGAWLDGVKRQLLKLGTNGDDVEKLVDEALENSIRVPGDSPPPPADIAITTNPEVPAWKRKFIQLALVCSPYVNFCKIISLPSLEPHDEMKGPNLTGLNGIRALSLLWVILGHIYAFSVTGIDNLLSLKDVLDRFSFMFVSAAFYAVDTFLFLSGFLAYWSLAPQLKPGKSSFPKTLLMAYVNRYIRITPPYAALILLIVGLWPYIGNGPDYLQTIDVLCQDNWWANLLYVHNFVNTFGQCAPWTWYLSVDMQLSWLAPFAIFLFVRKPKLGWLLSTSGILIQIIVATTLTYVYNLPLNQFPPTNLTVVAARNYTDYYPKMYIPFYTRMGPYIVGLMCCHILVVHSSFLRRQIFSVRRLWLQGLLWVAMFALMLTLSYAPYGAYTGKYIDPHFADAMYNSLARTVWGVALGWLFLALAFNKAGPIGTILEWPGWAIPARLSYVAYLLHPLVILYYTQTKRHALHSADLVNIFLYMAVSCSALMLAIPFSLAFESPVIGIQRIFLKKK